ncbi:unnamed protein product, partial [Thlaspi arvense]
DYLSRCGGNIRVLRNDGAKLTTSKITRAIQRIPLDHGSVWRLDTAYLIVQSEPLNRHHDVAMIGFRWNEMASENLILLH